MNYFLLIYNQFFLTLPQKEPKNASPSKAPSHFPPRTSLDGRANAHFILNNQIK